MAPVDPLERPRIDRVDVVVAALPLGASWGSAATSMSVRRTVLVRVHAGSEHGWGECPTLDAPGYSSEWTDGARLALVSELAPALLAGEPDDATILHPMASTAIEAAVTDLALRRAGRSLATHLGAVRTRVPAGIVVGLQPDQTSLRAAVDRAVAEGYRRVKAKVVPGRDAPWLRGVRVDHPHLDLWVDANGAYDPDDADHLAALDALDALGLGLIEQPFAADRLDAHAVLARRLATPICLDEPLVSPVATIEAVERGACSVVNLKPARVGGWRTALEILTWCRGAGVDTWIGGMVESGVGRAANVAFAALDGVTLVGDLSPSSRFFPTDVVRRPITMDAEGWIEVPTGPGIGAEVDDAALDRMTESVLTLT